MEGVVKRSFVEGPGKMMVKNGHCIWLQKISLIGLGIAEAYLAWIQDCMGDEESDCRLFFQRTRFLREGKKENTDSR